MAINVNNDLQPFEWIVPCGIEGVAITSISREIGTDEGPTAFENILLSTYEKGKSRPRRVGA